jgi:hypothetical protein
LKSEVGKGQKKGFFGGDWGAWVEGLLETFLV